MRIQFNRRYVALVMGVVLAGCGVDGSGDNISDAAVVAADASLTTDAYVEPTRDWYCKTCMEFRCPGSVECFTDNTCRAVVDCLAACTSGPECDACTADSALAQRASLAASCGTLGCWTSCRSVVWPPVPTGECVAAGVACEPDLPGFETCCTGTCRADLSSPNCCLAIGDDCSTESECCAGALCEAGVCVPQTCEESICIPNGGLTCCNGNYICEPSAAVGLPGICCAPNGTVVQPDEDCCSGGVITDGDGVSTCAPLP